MKCAKKVVFIILSAALPFLSIGPVLSAQHKFSSLPKLLIFYSPSCQHCFKVRLEFMPRIEVRYRGVIEVEYLDIDNIENYKLLISLEEKYPLVNKNLPILFMQGHFLDEKTHNYRRIEEFVAQSLGKTIRGGESTTEVDLISYFKSFTLFTIITAGLIDGINPCAFTVIVFFVTFLSVQRYRKREILAVGLAFIFAVFLTYLLLGVGVFRILYSLKAFYVIKKIIYITAALACFVLFGLTAYDIFKYSRTGNVQEIVLRLPDKVKNLIHRIIGLHYRQCKEAEKEKRGVIGLSLSAISCGFLVCLLEAVCTGQIYLPTIAFVLKTSTLKIRALAYLIIYNIMFSIPLLLILLSALFGVTSAQFAKFLQKHMILTKVFLAGLLLGLGLILITGV